MFIFPLLAACLLAAGPPTPEQAELLRHIASVHEANRAAFTHGTFRFEFTRGGAASHEDARAGRFGKAATARGFYAFDSSDARYDVVFDRADMVRMEKRLGEDQAVSPIRSFRVLLRGDSALQDLLVPGLDGDEIIHAVDIDASAPAWRSCEFPLGVGNPEYRLSNVAIDIQRVLDGEVPLRGLDPAASRDGRKVVHISLELKKSVSWEYWIDLERGAIPLHYNSDPGGGGMTMVQDLDDVRFEPGAGWLPRRWTLTSNRLLATRIVVTEVDLGSPPPRSTFRLEFPRDVTLADRVRNLYYSTSRRDWSLADLPHAGAAGVRPLNTSFSAPPPIKPSEHEPAARWRTVLPVLGVIGLIAAIIGIIRLRRGR